MLTKNSTGVDLYYEVAGKGETVVLAAGAASSSLGFKQSGVADALAEHFQVVLFDYTGLGKSGRVESVTKSQWCEDMVSVLDAVGVERAHVGGVSLGSRVAARVALDYPSRVRTLVVDAPITHVDAEGDAALNRNFANPESSPRAESWKKMHGEDWAECIRFYGRARVDEALQEHLTLRPHLAEIQAPTLVCRGDLDDAVHPLEQAPEWHKAARDSWMWIVPGSTGSGVMSEFPQQFVEIFSAFTTAKKQ